MISDKVQEQRLRQKNTVIVTDYYDNGAARTRSSDHTKADDVRSGVILAKKYFLRGKLAHQETEFNPGMLYSFAPTAAGQERTRFLKRAVLTAGPITIWSISRSCWVPETTVIM